jgi:hypothetical protein
MSTKDMKPAVWRIFRNGRWSYSDEPSTRHQDRPAWQPLYAHTEPEEYARLVEQMGIEGYGSLFIAAAIRAKGQE